MADDAPFFTVAIGFAVLILATLLVRHQGYAAGEYDCAAHIAAHRERTGKLLMRGGLAASLLVFCIFMWELIG